MYRYRISTWLAILLMFFATGCYHAQVTTGESPGPQVIEESFANSWIYGLIPPPVVETAQQCPDGVAHVETQLSFVNQVVGALTLGIYTPMTIAVTCAAGTATGALPAPDIELERVTIAQHATEADINEAFRIVVAKATRANESVAVRFVK